MAHCPPPSIDEACACPSDSTEALIFCIFIIVMLLLVIFALLVTKITTERRHEQERQAAADGRVLPMYDLERPSELKQLQNQVDASHSKVKAVERKYAKLSRAVQAYVALRARRACLESDICLHYAC